MFGKTVTGIALLTVLGGCAATPRPTGADAAGPGRWVDLTHTYDGATLYWPNNTRGFEHTEDFRGTTPGGFFYSSYSLCTPEHGGTHLDSPIHFADARWHVDEIPLDSLIGPAVVVDISTRSAVDPDYLLSVADLEAWERRHGPMAEGSIVLVMTGYGRHYPDRQRYFGTARTGQAAIPELRFPGIGPEAAQWLLDRRAVKAVGIDTASIDRGQSTDFRAHRILLGANRPAFENVANLHLLPARGALVVALPMKVGRGSGGPLRIVARVTP